jgi:5-methylcytosine-specific restriction endonuclease McrA
VKRAVWIRDDGRCQWPLEGGGVCGSTLRAEIDHVFPLARGGTSTVENTRVLCRVHNDLAARRIFGDDWMDRFTRKRGTPRGADRPSSREEVPTVSCSHLR